MKPIHTAGILVLTLYGLAGCNPAPPQNPAENTETAIEAPDVRVEAPVPEAEADGTGSEAGVQTVLAPLFLDSFSVRALHIGDLSKGHFNLYVTGGEPAVVRAWVGDENATDVVVTKADFEVDHHCAFIEVPKPLPADARLWVELETADGTRMKGSTEVQ